MFNIKWDSDSQHPNCFDCKDKFSFFLRRHHCRKCGKIFCEKCIKNYIVFKTPHIVCKNCINILNNCVFINKQDLELLKQERYSMLYS